MEESKNIKRVKGHFTDERTNTYEFEVVYDHKTHSIKKVIALVMNGSIRISMGQDMQKRILSELKKEDFSKEEL